MIIGNRNNRIQIRQMFNFIAPYYDFTNTLISFGLDKWWRRKAALYAGLSRGGFGLDVCCGTGRLTQALAGVVGVDGQVIGVDWAEKMLETARRNIERSKYKPNIQLMMADATSLPFADNSFDGVTVGWGLKNVPDLVAAIAEMVRVVKPGGKVVSLDMAKPDLPIFKQLYWLYFERIIPVLGMIGAGNRAAYQYLYHSSRDFLPPQDLAGLFTETGLSETNVHNLCGGVVAIVEGRKPYGGMERK